MLSVIIPARSSTTFTTNCLSSVLFTFQFVTFPTEFILIDDNSDQKEGILPLFLNFRKSVKHPVKIIRFHQRQHYTGVFTCGLFQAQGNQVFFLSNDMMLTPDFLKTVLSVANLENEIGIVRGISQHTDSHSEHNCLPPFPMRGYQDILDFSNYISRYHGLHYVEDLFLSGDAVLIKRNLLDKIGVMDTRFFGYFGDLDYGIRAKRAGFKLVCAKGAWLHHEGGGHVKHEASTENADLALKYKNRMEMVQTAYTKFREKWDTSMPEIYPGSVNFNWQKLHSQKVDFSEYEPPQSLDLQICQTF
jgi:GT2 family glycosyltransferase